MKKSEFTRNNDRAYDALRPLKITRNYLKWPEGSVLIEQGFTKVIVTASIEEGVPRFLKDTGKGWITAQYGMLPRSTDRRMRRDRRRGYTPGRSQEIQRLIGRGIRAAFDIENLGEVTVKIDCDVIQADGGTRCASITGAFVACYDAFQKVIQEGILENMPKFKVISAISVGYINDIPMLDLNYDEDSNAGVDMNIIIDEAGNFIEIQGTAEGKNFSRKELQKLLDLAEKGNQTQIKLIKDLLEL
jgi:ribonuclease PH